VFKHHIIHYIDYVYSEIPTSITSMLQHQHSEGGSAVNLLLHLRRLPLKLDRFRIDMMTAVHLNWAMTDIPVVAFLCVARVASVQFGIVVSVGVNVDGRLFTSNRFFCGSALSTNE
jgi:hypothetical protein